MKIGATADAVVLSTDNLSGAMVDELNDAFLNGAERFAGDIDQGQASENKEVITSSVKKASCG